MAKTVAVLEYPDKGGTMYIESQLQIRYSLSSMLVILTSFSIWARILQVGPGKEYAVPSKAAAVAKDGDTIAIDAGKYTGDEAKWHAHNLPIAPGTYFMRITADNIAIGTKTLWVFSEGRLNGVKTL